MTWRDSREARDDDLQAFCFYESFLPGKSFITPEKLLVLAWRRHNNMFNQIVMTHFWDGEGTPAEFPADRIHRVDPLGFHANPG